MHVHNCVHKEVKYCAECQKVYCKGCGKEWKEPELIYDWYSYSTPIFTGDEFFHSSSDAVSCGHIGG